jgi:hypothetical protein
LYSLNINNIKFEATFYIYIEFACYLCSVYFNDTRYVGFTLVVLCTVITPDSCIVSSPLFLHYFYCMLGEVLNKWTWNKRIWVQWKLPHWTRDKEPVNGLDTQMNSNYVRDYHKSFINWLTQYQVVQINDKQCLNECYDVMMLWLMRPYETYVITPLRPPP